MNGILFGNGKGHYKFVDIANIQFKKVCQKLRRNVQLYQSITSEYLILCQLVARLEFEISYNWIS